MKDGHVVNFMRICTHSCGYLHPDSLKIIIPFSKVNQWSYHRNSTAIGRSTTILAAHDDYQALLTVMKQDPVSLLQNYLRVVV